MQRAYTGTVSENYREAAQALHDAIGRLRDSNAWFVEWLPFIHVDIESISRVSIYLLLYCMPRHE
jgi:hypothetical protein